MSARKEAFLRARRRALPREASRIPDPFDTTRKPAIDFFQVIFCSHFFEK